MVVQSMVEQGVGMMQKYYCVALNFFGCFLGIPFSNWDESSYIRISSKVMPTFEGKKPFEVQF